MAVRASLSVEPPDPKQAAGVGALASDDEHKLDSSAVASLYFKYANELRSFLIGVLRDGELASEALQATFVKALELGHTARDETRKGWLFRVAFNEAMLLRRRQKVQDNSYRKLAWSRPQPGDRETEAEQHVVRWETVEQVRQALDQLSHEQRQVVSMRIYDEKTFAAIAEELSLPLGTVLSRMRLAMKKLSERLNRDEEN